jgi:hypothetical protein
MTNTSDEQRDSFRVDMNAIAQIKPVSSEIMSGVEYFPELTTYSAMTEIALLDTEINLLADRIKDLAVQKTLKLIQKKIDLTLKAQEIDKIQELDLKVQTINIGEGGCLLTSTLNVSIGDKVALALVQSSHYFTFFTIARVVELTTLDNQNQVHLTFESLTKPENTMLIQHLFKIQTAQAKQSNT